MVDPLEAGALQSRPVLSDQFMLDPSVVFLNHGSFGACPKPVFEAYQRWQRELELDPVNFIQRRLPGLLDSARAKIAEYAGTSSDQLIFVPNATYGINVVARSIDLHPGDEVLATNHEYGAVNNTWRFVCEKRRARFVQAEVDLPVVDADSVVDSIWSDVTDRTRVLCVSHVTAPTALILPVRALCSRAREAGIITVIDGAHALGQIDLDLDDLGADYYAGNAHKWLCAPKGAAILYSRDGRDSLLEPLVVSHGWSNEHSVSRLQDNFGWTGTDDPSSYLSISDAIDFQQANDWPSLRLACHSLASYARRAIDNLTGLEPICPDSFEWYSQMFVARLPQRFDHDLRDKLWERFSIEVPVGRWNEQPMIRVSIQAYNSLIDVERLLEALETVMQE